VSEQLIDLLKFGLLALLYLFFLRVIWAVWTELRAPALEVDRPRRVRTGAARPDEAPKSGPSRRSRRKPSALTVVEPPELAGARHPLSAEITMGRAPGCTIVIDDTFVSQLHARVFEADGDHHVEDLGSTNGTHLNGTQISNPQRLRGGDRIQVGSLVVEFA
jgi:hypothetical protein